MGSSVTGQRTGSKLSSAAPSWKINTQETNKGRKGKIGFIQEAGNLGRWWTKISKTIFTGQVKVEGFKGGRLEKAVCWKSR